MFLTVQEVSTFKNHFSRLAGILRIPAGVDSSVVNYRALSVTVVLIAVLGVTGTAQTNPAAQPIESGQPPSPEWLRPGTVRFSRLDGGALETQKELRSSWAAGFSPQDREITANLYGKYADRVVDLLIQANINFVWITYSVGFSWQDEAAQRAQAREILRKLHGHGIKVAAYMCASTIFWESMFKDVPQSVKWIEFDPKGIPYRYHDSDVMRFIADIDNPGWVDYQKRRIGAIIDDGFDAVFFDNPPPGYTADSLPRYFDQLRNYARREKGSNIAFFTNFGLRTPLTVLNRTMDLIYDEEWVEPGAWGGQWDVSNIRRDRWVRGMNPGEKAFITEPAVFHIGTRDNAFLGARSQKLAIAEAAAFGESDTWDLEGPFETGLITQSPKALQAWAAITQYNTFLAHHAALYGDAVSLTPWVVLLPDNLDPGWEWKDGAARLDFLAQNNVLCAFKLAGRITKKDLAAYDGVIIPAYASLSVQQKQMIRDYEMGGGKVYIFAETSSVAGLNGEILPTPGKSLSNGHTAKSQALAEITSLVPAATRIELETSSHVLANVTSVQDGKRLIVHLLNYDQAPVDGLKMKLVLGKNFQRLAGRKPALFSPDTAAPALEKLRWKGSTLEATLPSIDTYSVLVLQ